MSRHGKPNYVLRRMVAAVLLYSPFLLLYNLGVLVPMDYCEGSVMDGSGPYVTVEECRADLGY